MTAMEETSLVALDAISKTDDIEIVSQFQATILQVRFGRPFLIQDGTHFHYCLAIDGMKDSALRNFMGSQFGRMPLLILTPERGDILGLKNDCPISMPISAQDTPESLLALASSNPSKVNRRPILEQPNAVPALELLAEGQLLPTCLFFADIQNVHSLIEQGTPVVNREHFKGYKVAKVASLKRKSEAPIPVRGGIKARMVVFEYATGETETALMVANPDRTKPLTIRIHSACATGDIFGSERCDCGDQLRLAIERLDEMDGGAVLYLAQEGRGIGLVNKMRAYDLQDQSLDTVDANHALGFEDDRRDFAVAAQMIRALGWSDVNLMTNNPKKVDELRENGITVLERLEHQAPRNENNTHYLKTKAQRSGHLLDY